MKESKPHSSQALDIARKLVERDAETPEWRRRIEVGRGGLMLLATTLIDLEEQYENYAGYGEILEEKDARIRDLEEQLEALREALDRIAGGRYKIKGDNWAAGMLDGAQRIAREALNPAKRQEGDGA